VSVVGLAMALSLLVAALGAIGVVAPAELRGIARHFQTPTGLYAAAAIRVVLGGTLVLAAPTSRAPRVIRAVGVVILVAGLITPFLGLDQFRGILEWLSAQGPTATRIWAGGTLAFGCLLIYALFPKSRASD
jgi:hypothetical protein